MATTKAKKPVAKKTPAKRPATKKPVARKATTTSSRSTVSRRLTLSRTDEYTQLTWVLICIWLILIAIFLVTVIGRWS